MHGYYKSITIMLLYINPKDRIPQKTVGDLSKEFHGCIEKGIITNYSSTADRKNK